jgi:hypothetical protein
MARGERESRRKKSKIYILMPLKKEAFTDGRWRLRWNEEEKQT